MKTRAENIKRVIITLGFILLAFLVFRLYETNRELKSEIKTFMDIDYPDTVYRDKPYVPTKSFKYTDKPKVVTIYKTLPSVNIDKVVYHTDTIKLYLKDSTTISYTDKFLSFYPESPKLLQLELNDKNLDIDLFSIQGEVTRLNYKINTNKYRYLFDGVKLTHEKKPFIKRFNISLSYQIRPINNLHDLEFGIKYNTSKFNYVTGINGFYYPTLKKNPGWDIFFKVEYTF